MAKSIHRKKSSNRIPLTPDVRKAVILEADSTYAQNVRGLFGNPEMFRRIHPNLMMSAFRRAGLNLKESMHLLMA